MSWKRTGATTGYNSPAPAQKRMTTSTKPPQVKVRDIDKGSIFRCSRCSIEYKTSKKDRASCPLCLEIDKVGRLQESMKEVVDSLDLHKKELIRLRSQLGVLDGMRDAVGELNDEDRLFLKELVYRWRDAPSEIRVTQATKRRKVEKPGYGTAYRDDVSGWVVTYMDVEPFNRVEHHASSIGGAVMALQFSEALKVAGLKTAMTMLTKALSEGLTNA